MYYVYRFLDANENVIYVGKTADIRERMYQHFSEVGHLPKECYDKVHKIEYLETKDSVDGTIIEKYLINEFRPMFNSDYVNSDIIYSLNSNEFAWKIYDRNFCRKHKYTTYNSSKLLIAKKRLENGWTQQDVADMIGTTKGHYSNIERGIRLPAYEYIVRLQHLFNMLIDELLQEDN